MYHHLYHNLSVCHLAPIIHCTTDIWPYLPVVQLANQEEHSRYGGHRVELLSVVRFLPPLLLLAVFAFFLALTTLMGGGVPVRGMSSSTSYGGNTEGSGVDTAPLPADTGRSTGSTSEAEGGTAPSGISPILSMMNDCGDDVLGVLRRLGKREFSAGGRISTI